MNRKNAGSAKTKSQLKQLIKEAKLPERWVSICLDQGLQADMEKLEGELSELGKGPNFASLGEDPQVAVAQEIEALRTRMADRSIEFRFRALPRQKFTDLLKAHPPRDDDKYDAANGYNVDTFYEALVRLCAVSPDLDADDWATLLGDGSDENPGVLSSAQYDVITNTAWMANRRDVDIPFSPAALRLVKISSTESTAPSGLV